MIENVCTYQCDTVILLTKVETPQVNAMYTRSMWSLCMQPSLTLKDSCLFDVLQLQCPVQEGSAHPLFHLQEQHGEGARILVQYLQWPFPLTGQGPMGKKNKKKTSWDKQWTIELRDEQRCEFSMCHYGTWIRQGWRRSLQGAIIGLWKRQPGRLFRKP